MVAATVFAPTVIGFEIVLQALASVTVTVYELGKSPVAVWVVAPLLHK
jgi:hypothetical protein